MGFVAEYEITCEHLPLVEVANAVPEATLEIEIGPDQGGHPPFIVYATGGENDAVEQAFDDAAFVGLYTLAGRTGGTARYKIQPAIGMDALLGNHVDDLSALRGLARTDSVIDRIRVTTTGWIQTGWFADRETLEEFQAFWRRNGEFTLRRLTPDGDADDSSDGLTDRQYEALRTAYEMGYFEIPRTTSLRAVAGELDITAPSLSERLRRAQTHLVETTLSEVDTPSRSRQRKRH
ncbi:helix-turn-helix domain-containing protein [Natrialba sp. INN-245]|uniref:helix-turn-helix domain-containing protein n=1 Tax=Natrialba sp. INN-245 TaxID=2690967 RepID=UPI0013106F81|nr:helix-turn-helix domain-containing protein [Natrialba sp. INN-245]MWV40531.1 DNA-binding protein [Natrialba sp. INN-245]